MTRNKLPASILNLSFSPETVTSLTEFSQPTGTPVSLRQLTSYGAQTL